MTFQENKQDLFSVGVNYHLAHCISADFALGAGIALKFNELYDMRKRLKWLYSKDSMGTSLVGCALLIDNVFNLVTKEKCSQKPTYFTLEVALNEMKEHMVSTKATKLAMPKIGCGLDKLNWDIVKLMIQKTFIDTDIDILICYME